MKEGPRTIFLGSAFYPPLMFRTRFGVHIRGPLIWLRFHREALVLSPRKGLRVLLRLEDLRVPLSRIGSAKTILGKGVRFVSDDPVLDGLAIRPYDVPTPAFIALLEERGIPVVKSPLTD